MARQRSDYVAMDTVTMAPAEATVLRLWMELCCENIVSLKKVYKSSAYVYTTVKFTVRR